MQFPKFFWFCEFLLLASLYWKFRRITPLSRESCAHSKNLETSKQIIDIIWKIYSEKNLKLPLRKTFISESFILLSALCNNAIKREF
ncbi:hypothetical protein RIR_jg34987.t1 [Rhizophagus irregularis DAOM 181602=DAOM 197198]|nr:hypothetical protein RIR_jg34987.t1 [Rhizophagus irregularis DAOM 181602=DAOM 197198]